MMRMIAAVVAGGGRMAAAAAAGPPQSLRLFLGGGKVWWQRIKAGVKSQTRTCTNVGSYVSDNAHQPLSQTHTHTEPPFPPPKK